MSIDLLYIRSKRRRNGIRILCIFLLINLFIFSSGCIHVDLGNFFDEPEPEVKDYRINTKEGFPLKHVFNFEQDNSIKKSETQPFYIKKGTEWANLSIIVVINNYEFINNSPIDLSLLEQFVHVTLTAPDDSLFYDNKFTESAEIIRPMDEPEPGRWIVAVDAKGFGYQGNYDSYEINIVVYEPE